MRRYLVFIAVLLPVMLAAACKKTAAVKLKKKQEKKAMKKNSLFLVLMAGMFIISLPGQQVKKYDIRTAYVYLEETLLISESDLNCSYFIKKSMSEDLQIIGGDRMDWGKKDYSDGDKMFINKGSNHGIQEGDIFLVIGKGPIVSNRLTWKILGTLYLKKSLAEVTCIYGNTAVITLDKGCYPVNVGDFLIPFKPQKTLFERKPIYTLCRIPRNRIEGNVVFSSVYLDAERVIPGSQEYITIDLGKAMVEKGDFLLFYKLFGDDLPHLIIGTGIVIDSQNTNSTVKVLDAESPIEVGVKLVVLQKEDLELERIRKSKMRRLTEEEEIPIIEKLEEEAGEAIDAETLDVNILFDLDEKTVKETYKTELEKIGQFIENKSEYVIILRGYTCSIGNAEYNLRLSKERVDNVKKYLMDTFNIKEEFFETYHYGEKEALFDNTSEEERRKNRLVNIQVIGKQ
ncbi:MAG: OmpA family protein [Candidatus Aminicenantes bacterium]|nr:MAG: OmpA family protein [Candidatus Aminicenantes bacterium]